MDQKTVLLYLRPLKNKDPTIQAGPPTISAGWAELLYAGERGYQHLAPAPRAGGPRDWVPQAQPNRGQVLKLKKRKYAV